MAYHIGEHPETRDPLQGNDVERPPPRVSTAVMRRMGHRRPSPPPPLRTTPRPGIPQSLNLIVDHFTGCHTYFVFYLRDLEGHFSSTTKFLFASIFLMFLTRLKPLEVPAEESINRIKSRLKKIFFEQRRCSVFVCIVMGPRGQGIFSPTFFQRPQTAPIPLGGCLLDPSPPPGGFKMKPGPNGKEWKMCGQVFCFPCIDVHLWEGSGPTSLGFGVVSNHPPPEADGWSSQIPADRSSTPPNGSQHLHFAAAKLTVVCMQPPLLSFRPTTV